MTGSAQQLNDHDRELLSSYIDDALTASEREALEKRLAHEPELHIELDELHSVVQALHSLRAVSPPRSFTIDLAAEAKARPWWMSIRGMFGATGTIAALFVPALGIEQDDPQPRQQQQQLRLQRSLPLQR